MDVKDGGRTIARLLAELDSGSVTINRDYQRSRAIWPPTAQSYFIESILLGFPIPKLALYPKTDVKSRLTVEEIVDGQQRTDTLQQFILDNVRVPKRSELACAGKCYSAIGETLQQRFLSYVLPIDLFLEATPAQIREMFRRINSYQAPLNAEEKRHARFQGEFKWFIHTLAGNHSQTLMQLGTLKERNLIRMADVKWLAEVLDAMLSGIRTTRKSILDALYRDNDKSFPDQNRIAKRIDAAIPIVARFPAAQGTELSKHYNLYALILAVMHLRSPIEPLQEAYRIGRHRGKLNGRQLERLNAALDDPEEYPEYEEFIDACSEGTNVEAKRVIRFQWMCRALIGNLP